MTGMDVDFRFCLDGSRVRGSSPGGRERSRGWRDASAARVKPIIDEGEALIGWRELSRALRDLVIGAANVRLGLVNRAIARVKTARMSGDTTRCARERPRRPRGRFTRSMTSVMSSITTSRARSATSRPSDPAIRASIADAHPQPVR
jgi:hypothetical protein